MAHIATATIPGGYWVGGACRRDVRLRAPNGADLAYLAGDADSLLPAQWATEALARCVESVGDVAPVSRDVVRSLTIGDREALLLHVRRLVAGDAARCTAACPACQEVLDLDVTIASLLLPEYPTQEQIHDVAIGDTDGEYRVRFRLPTGHDQERAAVVARSDASRAADLLLSACVESVTDPGGAAIDRVPAALRDPIERAMSRLDAQAELMLAVTCASCGHRFSAMFDAAAYLRHELRRGMRVLERDRHLLAFHYHWSASEILAMPAHERRRCVAVLEQELSRSAQP